MKIVTVAAAAAVLGIAGCSSVAKTPSPAHTTAATPASGKAAASPADSKAAPSPAGTLSAPLGDSYTVTGQSGNRMVVALTKVIDPAQAADQFSNPQGGNRFVGAVFDIKGINGTSSDDANNDATLIGSNGQTYTADFDRIAGYTNFDNGEYSVSAGESSVGAVTFQVPVAVTVAKIEWSASGGLGGVPAEWLIPPRASAAGTPAPGGDPWNVISAYYQDITLRDYAAAWKLLGPDLQSRGYASFVAGYADTGQQTVTKVGQSGGQVSFNLRSANPDGTVQTFQATETVTDGKIVAAHIVQTS